VWKQAADSGHGLFVSPDIRVTKLRLDRTSLAGLAFNHGGMAERFKAAVLKTVDRKVRGFESLSLRQ
jgi:hypothetical protein